MHETSRPIQRHRGLYAGAISCGVQDSGFLRNRTILPSPTEGEDAHHSPLAGHHEAERLLAKGVDIITGGFPCQDISTAGKGAGIQYDKSTGEAHTRSGLFGQLVRTIRLVRPRYALLENVAALLSRGMGTVLGDLAEIGYDTEWDCISAADVGAHHIRERIWILAHDDSFGGRAFGASGSQKGPAAKAAATSKQPRNVANANPARELQPQGFIQDQWGRTCDRCQEVAHPEKQSSRDERKDGRSLGRKVHSPRDTGCLGGRHDKPRNGMHVANSECNGCAQVEQPIIRRATEQRPTGEACEPSSAGWGPGWPAEPNVGRVAHGVSFRVDRLKGLGNAIVPQIAELLGKAIIEKAEGEGE
jgi:DNA (cytosine-5)-methyltransferase 1